MKASGSYSCGPKYLFLGSQLVLVHKGLCGHSESKDLVKRI